MMTEIWTWTVIASIGVVVQAFIVAYSIHRLREAYVLAITNGDRRRILIAHIRSGSCYWVTHAIFLYVGLRIIIGFDFGALAWLFIFAQFCLLYAGLADFGDLLYWRRRAERRHDERSSDGAE